MRANKKTVLYEEILMRLIGGDYRFGEPISVKELCSSTGASRQPIMAALNALSADGFVNIIPQVGCEVVNPTVRDIQDFYQMFSRLEGLLAELAAQRRTAAQLAALKDINSSIARDLADNAGSRYAELNRAFHTTFHAMANSPLLMARQSSVFAMSDLFIAQTVGFRPHINDAFNEHEAVIQAISDRDGSAARRNAEAHIDNVAQAVMGNMSPR